MRRMDKIFKSMELFVGTRQAEQCRSHHQKMEKKYHNFITIVSNLRNIHYNSADVDLLLQDMQNAAVSPPEGLATIEELKTLENICPPLLEASRERKKSTIVPPPKLEQVEERIAIKEEFKEVEA